MQYIVYAAAAWSWFNGADVFITPEGGPILGLRHTDQYSGVEIRQSYKNPQTGMMEYPPYPDWCVARVTTGAVYIQVVTTWIGADESGNPALLQDPEFFLLYWPP